MQPTSLPVRQGNWKTRGDQRRRGRLGHSNKEYKGKEKPEELGYWPGRQGVMTARGAEQKETEDIVGWGEGEGREDSPQKAD